MVLASAESATIRNRDPEYPQPPEPYEKWKCPMSDDLRLIEDYLPIEAISAEASREKSVRKGHISTLHLWWARRPLVACRAAVYGALVPDDRWVKAVDLTKPPLQKGEQGGVDQPKAERLKNGK